MVCLFLCKVQIISVIVCFISAVTAVPKRLLPYYFDPSAVLVHGSDDCAVHVFLSLLCFMQKFFISAVKLPNQLIYGALEI